MEPPASELVKRLRAATMRPDWGDLPDDVAIPAVPLLREAADALTAQAAMLEEMRRVIAGASTWYWPEGDTSSESCRDSPREVFEDMPSGDVEAYSCGGVVYTQWYGWLPPAEDSDSDDEFEVDEPTEELAVAKMKAEQDRRALASNKAGGDRG